MDHDSVASGRYEPSGVCAALRFGAEHVGAEHVCAAPCGERPMTIRRSTFVTGAAILGASTLLLAACSPGSSDDDSGDGDSGTTTVTFRLRSEEHTSELQSRGHLVCRLLLEKKKTTRM